MGLFKRDDDPKKAAAAKAAAAKAVKAAKAGGKVATGEGRGRKSSYEGKRIYLKVKENPYRATSKRHANFKLVKDGMTYEAYKKAGGDPLALKFGLDKEHYTLK